MFFYPVIKRLCLVSKKSKFNQTVMRDIDLVDDKIFQRNPFISVTWINDKQNHEIVQTIHTNQGRALAGVSGAMVLRFTGCERCPEE